MYSRGLNSLICNARSQKFFSSLGQLSTAGCQPCECDLASFAFNSAPIGLVGDARTLLCSATGVFDSLLAGSLLGCCTSVKNPNDDSCGASRDGEG